ncbi:molybdenum cofactor cytidylyltransferase [Rhizobiales bacterium GAS191]|jgi:molybdenum cofactor cytidylyltransferase|nr:molybdenum cofactor cytidylyltransferase [Rhizobiales bacterium GAS191]
MRFGHVPLEEAIGSISAHAVRAGDVVLRKGSRLTADVAARLKAAGVTGLVAAQLDASDVHEDEAASALAKALAGERIRIEPPFTGRANLFAEESGVLLLDRERIDRINAVDEAITFATLPEFRAVSAGEMVATVKIIPYAVPRSALDAAIREGATPIISVAPYARRRIAAISTLLPGLKPSIVAKTLDVLAQRLAPAGASIVFEERVPHEVEPLAGALRRAMAASPEIVIVFGASAISDRRDVIPAAIEEAGGRVEHLGMPVDPGNLLLLADMGSASVLGAPGCARSPKENGFDWVLQRLLAALPVGRAELVAMGVGGLLMEIKTRPQPRAEPPKS